MSFATFKPDPFFNRSHELNALDRACKHRGKGAQMMMLYGRSAYSDQSGFWHTFDDERLPACRHLPGAKTFVFKSIPLPSSDPEGSDFVSIFCAVSMRWI